MALLDEFKADQLAARKSNDRLKADLLTTLIGEATQITTEEFKRGVTEITDEKVAATVAKFLKNTKLTLENLASERARLIEAGGDTSKVEPQHPAPEFVQQVLRENTALLSRYPATNGLPELRQAIDDFRAANPDANVGTIMAHLKTNFGGQYDGKAASALARG